jgi:hypothetical protein
VDRELDQVVVVLGRELRRVALVADGHDVVRDPEQQPAEPGRAQPREPAREPVQPWRPRLDPRVQALGIHARRDRPQRVLPAEHLVERARVRVHERGAVLACEAQDVRERALGRRRVLEHAVTPDDVERALAERQVVDAGLDDAAVRVVAQVGAAGVDTGQIHADHARAQRQQDLGIGPGSAAALEHELPAEEVARPAGPDEDRVEPVARAVRGVELEPRVLLAQTREVSARVGAVRGEAQDPVAQRDRFAAIADRRPVPGQAVVEHAREPVVVERIPCELHRPPASDPGRFGFRQPGAGSQRKIGGNGPSRLNWRRPSADPFPDDDHADA